MDHRIIAIYIQYRVQNYSFYQYDPVRSSIKWLYELLGYKANYVDHPFYIITCKALCKIYILPQDKRIAVSLQALCYYAMYKGISLKNAETASLNDLLDIVVAQIHSAAGNRMDELLSNDKAKRLFCIDYKTHHWFKCNRTLIYYRPAISLKIKATKTDPNDKYSHLELVPLQ